MQSTNCCFWHLNCKACRFWPDINYLTRIYKLASAFKFILKKLRWWSFPILGDYWWLLMRTLIWAVLRWMNYLLGLDFPIFRSDILVSIHWQLTGFHWNLHGIFFLFLLFYILFLYIIFFIKIIYPDFSAELVLYIYSRVQKH